MNHRFLVRFVLLVLLGTLALVTCAGRTSAETPALTASASISQDSLTGYSVKVDLTGAPRERIDIFLTQPSQSRLTYAMVEYRGALEGGGSCWPLEGVVRCYGSTDVNGSAHIDFTFETSIGGPTPLDLFVCRGSACEWTELYLAIPPIQQGFVPLVRGGPSVGEN